MALNTLAPESRRQLTVALKRERQRLRFQLRRSEATRRAAERPSGDVAARPLRRRRAVDDGAAALTSWTTTPDTLLRERLTEVEAALQRLAGTSYGQCEACERPIEIERLYARPWTRFCNVCAQGAAVGSPPGERSLGG